MFEFLCYLIIMEKSDITFVVQGPIIIKDNVNLAKVCLESVRKFFPSSKIILSTHLSECTDGLDFDECVINSRHLDERIIENDKSGQIATFNLQLASSFEGLKRVITPYSIKLRSDMVLLNDNLYWLLNNRPDSNINRFTLTDELVITLNWAAVNPTKFLKLLHHPSDQIFAGKTSDLYRIWDCPQYPLEYVRWFYDYDYPLGAQHGGTLVKYRFEAWLWYNFVKVKTKYPFNNSYSFSSDLLDESQGFMGNNLMIVNLRMAGVRSLKNLAPQLSSKVKMFTYNDWVKLSRKYGIKSQYKYFDLETIVVTLVRFILKITRNKKYVFPD
jgi:hypothetical protein